MSNFILLILFTLFHLFYLINFTLFYFIFKIYFIYSILYILFILFYFFYFNYFISCPGSLQHGKLRQRAQHEAGSNTWELNARRGPGTENSAEVSMAAQQWLPTLRITYSACGSVCVDITPAMTASL